uniref:Uncharacterized protein n=1 Tax=Chlorokybus atmophyticus TaxID=3144 RepID=A2CI47_CHLAT|nr:hypothetical protein ChatCp031 [Chlorokybus atmophyticus]ABM87978.1 hypothetical protein [Chlorokybus atmophyticus]WKT05670.1 hypothetical protein [Chlorokybus atmophyticus]
MIGKFERRIQFFPKTLGAFPESLTPFFYRSKTGISDVLPIPDEKMDRFIDRIGIKNEGLGGLNNESFETCSIEYTIGVYFMKSSDREWAFSS